MDKNATEETATILSKAITLLYKWANEDEECSMYDISKEVCSKVLVDSCRKFVEISGQPLLVLDSNQWVFYKIDDYYVGKDGSIISKFNRHRPITKDDALTCMKDYLTSAADESILALLMFIAAKYPDHSKNNSGFTKYVYLLYMSIIMTINLIFSRRILKYATKEDATTNLDEMESYDLYGRLAIIICGTTWFNDMMSLADMGGLVMNYYMEWLSTPDDMTRIIKFGANFSSEKNE